MNKEIRGTALVTGASSGIGREYAIQLARRGCDVILTARRGDRLRELEQLIGAQSGRKVVSIVSDLADAAGVQYLLAELRTRGVVPDLLINNAGRGYYGAAVNTPAAVVNQMLRLNIEALTTLSLELGRAMAARGSGGIINVASTAAYQPVPYLAVYAATKAYVINFSEALAAELSCSGVRVFTVAPGATRSEFVEAAGVAKEFTERFAFVATSAEGLVERSLQAFERQVYGDTYVDGLFNQAGALFSRISPRFLVTYLTAGLLRTD